jgi:hypothetical protein
MPSSDGRPIRYTDKKILEALRESAGIRTVAARRLGCDRKTIERRIKKSIRLQEALVDIEEENGDVWLLRERHPTMLIFYAKTKLRHRGYVQTYEGAADRPRDPFPDRQATFSIAPAKDEEEWRKGPVQ